MVKKPTPRTDVVNASFFAACDEDTLLIQRCAKLECGRYVFYPRVCCPMCRHGELDWVPVSGRGRIATYTIVHRPHHESFAADSPYVFAAVRIDEGPIIFGRVETDVASPPRIGDAVEPIFVQHAPDRKLLAFRLAEHAAIGVSGKKS